MYDSYQKTYINFFPFLDIKTSENFSKLRVHIGDFQHRYKEISKGLNLFSIQYLNDLWNEIRSQRHFNLLIMESHMEDQPHPIDIERIYQDLCRLAMVSIQGTGVIPSQFHQMAKLVSGTKRNDNVIPVVNGWEEGSKGKG